MDLLRFGLLGLGTGALYALTALGINVVYRATGVINFAAGAVGAVCALTFYDLVDNKGLAWPTALAIVLVLGGLLGAMIHQVVIERLRKASAVMKLVATLGVLLLLQGIAQLIFGEARLARSFLPITPITFTPDLVLGLDRIILVGSGCGLAVILMLVYRRTRFGLATSAVAENRRAASALGWSARTIELANCVIAGVLSALAGVLLAPIVGLDVNTLVLLIIPALAAALIGGFTSFPLTIMGGLMIGVLEAAFSVYNADVPGLSRAVPFLVIVFVIVAGGRARPTRADRPIRLPSVSKGVIKKSWLLFGSALALVGIVTLGGSWIHSITMTLLAMLMLFSIIVLTGYAGQISLAQWSLAGIGAWTAGRMVSDHEWPFWAALGFGVLATVFAGLVVALPALRTRGVNLAVVTIGLGVVIEAVIFKNADLTGGQNGTDIGDPTLFGIAINSIEYPARYATLVLIAVVLIGLMVSNLRRGRSGLRLLAVRSNERAAAALGINVFGVKLYAFAVAAFIAGIGGVLAGFNNQLIVFSQFTVFGSIQYVVFAFLGGVGWLAGAIYGAMFAPGSIPAVFVDQFINIQDYVVIIGGASIILMLMLNPDGIASVNAHVFGALHAKLGSHLKWRPVLRSGRKERPLSVLPKRERTRDTLEVVDLTVRYGGFVALDGVSFRVAPASVTGLIGPNGAGKTTLLDAVSGFAAVSEGKLLLGDRDITHWSASKRARAGIGRSWQSVELFEELSVYDNLRTATDRHNSGDYVRDLLHPGRVPTTEMMATVIKEFELEPVLAALPASLPQGTRRLVGIARAMLAEPEILFLDEPAAGLDQHESMEFGRMLRRVARDYQISVVLVEHDVPLVMSTCDRIVVLNFGKKIAEGAPSEIRTNPHVVAAYLGEPDADNPDFVDDEELTTDLVSESAK